FTVLDQVLLHPLDVPDPSALLTVQRRYDGPSGVHQVQNHVVWNGVDRFRDTTTAETAFATASTDRATRRMVVRTDTGGREEVDGRFVSGNYFRVLALRPALGRNFEAADDAAGASPTVMLGDRYWRAQFAADRSVVGRTFWINGTAATIIGVTPASFS